MGRNSTVFSSKIGAILCTALVLLISINVSAQTLVKGVISDSLKQALPGVSIQVKESSVKSVSAADGSYQITIPSGNGVLIFKFIGFKTTEIAVSGRTLVNVTLHEDGVELQSVVVTALGIKRSEKSLGYSAQTVQENAVKDAKSNNWASSLSGKVAGLTVQGAGAGPMGSSRITLRGESSLNLDNNQALIIVDGVPISNKITGTKYSSHLSADSPVDYGSAVSDINPDDIEKITALKILNSL